MAYRIQLTHVGAGGVLTTDVKMPGNIPGKKTHAYGKAAWLYRTRVTGLMVLRLEKMPEARHTADQRRWQRPRT
jgi:hypothetical protein